jgi:hypothetical protein
MQKNLKHGLDKTAMPRVSVSGNRPPQAPSPGGTKMNEKSRTPTSVTQGKQSFGAGTKYCNTGKVDPGKGRGY